MNLPSRLEAAASYRNSQDIASRRKFFTKFTMRKAIFYCFVLAYCFLFTVISFLEPFLPDSIICNSIPASEIAKTKIHYENPSYIYVPCKQMNLPYLLFLSRIQCSFGRRLLASAFLGGIVGWERREADRPAGIRTMALVSLGVCLFSINSMNTFLEGPMGWDASRVSAAIPSGVGFLGAGLIFKEAQKDDNSGTTTHVVHGLTTAASLWMSAAIGMACAGELYFAASFTVATLLILLRFGPRQVSIDEEEDDEDLGDEHHDRFDDDKDKDYSSIRSLDESEKTPLQRQNRLSARGFRHRASLGGIL